MGGQDSSANVSAAHTTLPSQHARAIVLEPQQEAEDVKRLLPIYYTVPSSLGSSSINRKALFMRTTAPLTSVTDYHRREARPREEQRSLASYELRRFVAGAFKEAPPSCKGDAWMSDEQD